MNAIPQFVGRQLFRNEIGTAGKEKRRAGGSKKLAVNPRRRSDRARNRRPRGLPGTQFPGQAAAGLKLKAGVIVVLDLRPQRQMQPVLHQRNFILPKRAEPLAGDAGREKGQGAGVADVVLDQPVAESPDEVLALAQSETVLDIDIVSVEVFAKRAGNVAMSPVEIKLHFESGVFGENTRPAADDIAAFHGDVVKARLSNPAAVKVPLQCEEVASRRVPIQAKTALAHVPVIGRIPAARKGRAVTVKIFAIDSIMKTAAQRAAISNAAEPAQLRAAAARQESALSVLRIFGRDVDHSVDRVGAPQGGTRPADDFNPVDVLQERILRVPEHAGVQRRIDRAPVDQHQHFIGGRVVEPARADGPLVRIDLGDFQIGRQAQRLGKARGARAADVRLRDDLDGRCRFRQLFRPLGNRRHLDVHQLFHA